MPTKKKIVIDRDEWYPVYTIGRRGTFGKKTELTQAQINRIEKAEQSFIKAQEILSKAYEAASA